VAVVAASVVAAAFPGLARAVRPPAPSSRAFAFAGRPLLASGGSSGHGRLLGKGSWVCACRRYGRLAPVLWCAQQQ